VLSRGLSYIYTHIGTVEQMGICLNKGICPNRLHYALPTLGHFTLVFHTLYTGFLASYSLALIRRFAPSVFDSSGVFSQPFCSYQRIVSLRVSSTGRN
jgi:hypothetical protein